MTRDPYDVLGVPRSATADEVQKAYRKLSKKHHPDRNPGDKQADALYKEIQAAYEVLSDPAKKAHFDRFGTAGPAAGGFPGGGPGGVNFDSDAAQEMFRSMFAGGAGGVDLGDLFGGGRRAKPRGRRPPAEVVESEVTVPFDIAALGGAVPLEVDGRRIDVKVPAGIDTGKKLRVPAAATGSADVVLKVTVAPHPYFRRDGNDLLLDVPISLPEAVLGGKVEVPTVDNARLEVKVPPGTSGGAKLRLRGKGITGGDLYLVFKVVVPAGGVDDDSRRLIEQFAERNPQAPRANVPWR